MCLKSQDRVFGLDVALLVGKAERRRPMPACQHATCDACPIRHAHSFCNLPIKAREFLEANSISMEYPHGAVMFREGDRCNAIFLLCAGRAKVSATSREGRTLIVRLAGAGSALGMSAALSEEPYETTVETLEPCHVRVLRTEALRTLMDEFPQVAVAMARSLAEEYKAAFEEARRIALPTNPAGRLACLLLDWLASEKTARKGETITMNLTHDELASMTATTRETITRTLSKFKKDGVIKTHGVALTVLQPRVLQQLSAC